jgi:hypothetical protein
MDRCIESLTRRQVYALLGLVKKWGPQRVEAACARASEAEAYNVGLIGRMLERATEGRMEQVPIQGRLLSPRFARPADAFTVATAKHAQPDPDPGPERSSPADPKADICGQDGDRSQGGAA